MIELDGKRVPRIFVSAVTGEGLDLLRERVAAFASGAALNAQDVPASGEVGDAAETGASSEDGRTGRTGTYHSHA
jgi:hypothetical protein